MAYLECVSSRADRVECRGIGDDGIGDITIGSSPIRGVSTRRFLRNWYYCQRSLRVHLKGIRKRVAVVIKVECWCYVNSDSDVALGLQCIEVVKVVFPGERDGSIPP